MRRIEDQQRVENQNRIKAELERKREEAEKGYDTSRARRERGREEYYDWETRAQKVGLQGAGQMESVAKEWRRNVQIIRGYKDLLTEEQKGGKQAMTDDERYKADVQYAQAKQKLHELQQLIRAAAQYTGVNLTKEDGSNKQKSMDLVAQEVGERYKERHKEYQDLVVAEGNAERALADARAREQEQARLEKENESAIKRRRAEEDATLAHRAEEQAKAAEQRAQVAIEEQTRRDEREELKQRKAEEQAEVDSVREMLRQNMKLLQERATEEQKPAVQALERLLTRADDEPKVFDQIRAAATPNQEMSMDADQARRYGRDLRLLRAGGLDTQEVLGFLNLKAHEEHRLQNVSQYDEKLKAMDEEDSQARETERRQRVESLQERAKRARSHANRQAEAAEKSARTSDEDPLPGLNESLHGAQEVMQQQSETAQGTVAALRQFNATVGSCGAAISAQQNRINQLVSENNAVKQKMDSIARMNIA